MANVFVSAAAEAMRIKRRELIDLPLDRIWRDLAEVALVAAKTEQARCQLTPSDARALRQSVVDSSELVETLSGQSGLKEKRDV